MPLGGESHFSHLNSDYLQILLKHIFKMNFCHSEVADHFKIALCAMNVIHDNQIMLTNQEEDEQQDTREEVSSTKIPHVLELCYVILNKTKPLN